MKRKFSTLGGCVIALVALCAVVASAAQAVEYHGESATVYVGAESSDNIFTVTKPAGTAVSKVKCTSAIFSGESATKTATTLTVSPKYTGCTLNEVKATVETKACKYRFNQPTKLATNEFTATVDVIGCAEGAPIVIKTTGCEIKVGNQSGLKHVIIENNETEGNPARRHSKVRVTILEITETQTSGCPGGAGTFNTADYEGTATVLGYTDAAHTTRQGIWVE